MGPQSCQDPSKGRVRNARALLSQSTRRHIPQDSILQGIGDLQTCVPMLQAELALSYKGFQNILQFLKFSSTQAY
jgi:hypothetical protein